MSILSEIIKSFPDEEFVKAPDLDKAVIGIDTNEMRLIYSKAECIVETMLNSRCNQDDAVEYLNHNVFSAYVGKGTPIWCDDMY